MRTLLYEAANTLIQCVAKFGPLKAWATCLVQRKGLKKATVKTARKLAVILMRLWRDGGRMTLLSNVDVPASGRPRSGPLGGIPSPAPLLGGKTDPG